MNSRRIILLTLPSSCIVLLTIVAKIRPSLDFAMPLILEVLSRRDVETVLAGGGTPALRRAVTDFLRRTLAEQRPPSEAPAQKPSNEDPAP